MRGIVRITLLTTLGLAIWTSVYAAGTLRGWWRTPLAARGNSRAFLDAAIEKIDATYRGNAAFVLIEHGQVVGEHFVSVGKPIDRDSRFQLASLSKWITAWGVMTLVEAGKLDLDAPVSRYLTRWRLPASKFDNDRVTVRRLLSHTAGLTDGLGYNGFRPDARVQSLEESLSHAADAMPGADGVVRVGYAPGTAWRYSGGGFTLLQLIVEEVSGEPFPAYMKDHVLQRLGMFRSTFVLDDRDRSAVAEFYDADGKPAIHYRFTATGAASLYSTAADLTRFVQAQANGPKGEAAGRGVLRPAALEEMRRPNATKLGVDIWGLGTMLYASNNAGDFIIGHDGHNEPAINTTARVDPATGDGVVVIETGNKSLATTLGNDWVFWKVGNVDFVTVAMNSQRILQVLAVGWLVILVAAAAIGWSGRAATRPAPSARKR
jgi:CubicO group peptidase (beta-lactamase class C family)